MKLNIRLKPLATEKAVMKIESENVLTFVAGKEIDKTKIKEEIEKIFSVKVEKIRTSIRQNKKIIYVKLNKKFPAIDIATKLEIM